MSPCGGGHEVYLPLGAWKGVGEKAEKRLFLQVCVKYWVWCYDRKSRAGKDKRAVCTIIHESRVTRTKDQTEVDQGVSLS
jgi:hypothetical protein